MRPTTEPGRRLRTMTQGTRTERVGEEFREILAEEIPRLKDPRVGFVTVVGVRVSPDLRHAWVSYTSMGDEKAKAGTRAALRSARSHLRAAIGRQVRLKFLPELEFEEDTTYERGRRIDELLEGLRREDGGA
jgi:ribosome-binding factor A